MLNLDHPTSTRKEVTAVHSKNYRRTAGFTLIEVIVAVAIMGVLAGIAIPIALSFRSNAPEAAEQADVRSVATALDRALTSWKGMPPAQVTIASSNGTWTATPLGQSIAVSGKLSTGTSVTGTLWTDGSYCVAASNTSTSNTYSYRSDKRALEQNVACPTVALGGNGSTPNTSVKTLPSAPSGLTLTSPAANQVTATWTAASAASSYVVQVSGANGTSTTSTSATLTNIPAGTATVTVYAKNDNGTGPGVSGTVAVTSAANTAASVAQWSTLPLSNSWVNYDDFYKVNDWDTAQMTMSGGIVGLRGLIINGSTADGAVIATIPASYRPDTNMIFPALAAGSGGYINAAIEVTTAGEVKLKGAITAGAWISLDNVLFPASGTASWTNLTGLSNSWSVYQASTYGQPRYWQDSNGVVWMAGVVTGGNAADSTLMMNNPAANASSGYQMLRVASAGGGNGLWGSMYVNSGTGIYVRGGSGSTWLSLAGAPYASAAAKNKMTWNTQSYFGPSGAAFSNYAGGWSLVGFGKTSYGMVITEGLLNASSASSYGSGTTPVFFYLDSMRPARAAIFAQNSNNSTGRVDILPTGALRYNVGSSWGSVSGMAFFPN